MAKIKEFYNPTFEEHSYNGFVRAINEISSLGAHWTMNLGNTGLSALDDFILSKVGERKVFSFFDDRNSISSYIYMAHVLQSYNYQLDGLFNLMIPNDKSENGYNPLDNVFEIRHEERDIDFDKGEDTTTLDMGERKMSSVNPTRTDTLTSEGSTSPFDDTDFSKDTEKTVNTNSYGAFTVENNTDRTTDYSVNSSRHDDTKEIYDVKREGNIGVTTSAQLIDGDRRIHYFNFFDEVVKIIEKEFLSSMLWEV